MQQNVLQARVTFRHDAKHIEEHTLVPMRWRQLIGERFGFVCSPGFPEFCRAVSRISITLMSSAAVDRR